MKHYPLMRCGHVAQIIWRGSPVCILCYSLRREAFEPVITLPKLDNRSAWCDECHIEVPSDVNLPFFWYDENGDHDWFYCGCKDTESGFEKRLSDMPKDSRQA